MSVPSNLSNKLVTTNALWDILTEVTNNIYDNMPEPVDISGKANKNNPIFEGSMVLNNFQRLQYGLFSAAFGEYAVAFNRSSQAMGQVAAAAGIGSHAEGCGEEFLRINLNNIGSLQKDKEGRISSILLNSNFNLQNGDVIVGNSNTSLVTGSGLGDYFSLDPSLIPSSYVTIIRGSTAIGEGSHAEGYNTKAFGHYSHTEGEATVASGESSHVIGTFNIIDDYSNRPTWQENHAYKVGDKVQYNKNGYTCVTAHTSNSEEYPYNNSNWTADSKINYVEIVGNGTATNARSNARTLDWSGNEWLAGNLTAAGGTFTLGATALTEAQL